MATALGPITFYHVPVCPFSQRLAKSRGGTALWILETSSGQILRESLILLQYVEDVFPGPVLAESDPCRRAVEGLMSRMEADVGLQGYRFVFEPDRRLRPWPSKQKYGPSASDAELGL
jgi:glutathione S-transferase